MKFDRYSVWDITVIIILSSFFVLTPIIRWRYFFDSYIIKLWAVEIGTIIALIIFSSYRPRVNNNNVTIKYLLLGYLSINIISWLTVPYPSNYAALPVLISIITYILMCLLVSQYFKEPDIAILLWIISGAGIAIIGIRQYYIRDRVISTLGNENFLAAYIAMTILLCIGYLYRFLQNEKKKDKQYLRATALGAGIAGLLTFITVLYFTHSRGAWLGLTAGMISFIIIAYIPPGKRILTSLFVILTAVILSSCPAGIRFITKQFGNGVRMPIWEGTISMICAHPWLGCGKGAYFIFYPRFRHIDYWLSSHPTNLTIHAHNEFLQIWSETGIIGLIIFLGIIITVLWIAVKKIDMWKNDPSRRYLMIGMASSVICLLTHNLVSNNLQMPSSAISLWLVFGLIIGMASNYPVSPAQKSVRRFKPLIFLALTPIMVIIVWYILAMPMISQYLFRQAWRERGENRWPQAVTKYRKAVEWNPYDTELHYRLAYAYIQCGLLNKAIEEYKNVCKIAPDYGDVHRNMGIIYIKQKKYILAEQHFSRALKINPYDRMALHNLYILRNIKHGRPIRT